MNVILAKKNIKYKNEYKPTFWKPPNKTTKFVRYEIQIETENIIFPSPHIPKCIKKYTETGTAKYGKKYSFFCHQHCHSWIDIE